MIDSDARIRRRIETAAMLVIFASMLISSFWALSNLVVWPGLSMWTPPTSNSYKGELWFRIFWITQYGAMFVVLGLSAIAVVVPAFRKVLVSVIVAHVILAAVLFMVRKTWPYVTGREALPQNHPLLLALWLCLCVSRVIVPMAVYKLTQFRVPLGKAVRSRNRYRPPPISIESAKRFVQVITLAAAMSALLVGIVLVVDEFLMGDAPSIWISAGSLGFVFRNGLLLLWPVVLIWTATRWSMNEWNHIVRRIRILLVLDIMRFVFLLGAETLREFSRATPVTRLGDGLPLYFLWTLAQNSLLTTFVLGVLASLPIGLGGIEALQCAKCGYLLKGLESNRCPECGTPHNLEAKASEIPG